MDYRFRAISPQGRTVRGRMPAQNERDLEARLRQLGMDLIDARPAAVWRPMMAGRVPARELINFCYHMEMTTRGGVMLTEALSDLVDGIAHRGFRLVVASVLDAVREGAPLADALARHPATFDQVFVGMIRAGEASGLLYESFAKIGASLRWQDELAARLKKLVAYPAFTLLVLIGVAAFMLMYLVPQLAGFIQSTSGGDLPMQTRMLLAASQGLVRHWALVLAAPVVLAIAAAVAVRHATPPMRLALDRLRLRLPLAGAIIEKVALARLAGLLGMLYAAGVPVMQSLEVCRTACSNRWIAQGIGRVNELIMQGCGMTDAFRQAALFPSLVLRMVKIGESTGELDKALANVTYFFNREVDESLQRLQSAIEPILTVSLGLLLGWLMMAVLGPVYDLIAKIKI